MSTFTFTRFADGSCMLSDDSDVSVWSSDGDEDFLEEFDAQIEPEDIDDVIDYLEEKEYLTGDDSVDIEDEAESDDTIEIRTLDA